MTTVRRRLVVHGRVQGVGYRWSCYDVAVELGVSGWARNRPDGTVEVVAEGAGDRVDQLIAWCWTGPSHARVTSVEVTSEPPTGETGFSIDR